MQLSIRQREKLADMFGNMAVAWVAGGIIGPFVTNWKMENVNGIVSFSILVSMVFVGFMLYLSKEEKK